MVIFFLSDYDWIYWLKLLYHIYYVGWLIMVLDIKSNLLLLLCALHTHITIIFKFCDWRGIKGTWYLCLLSIAANTFCDTKLWWKLIWNWTFKIKKENLLWYQIMVEAIWNWAFKIIKAMLSVTLYRKQYTNYLLLKTKMKQMLSVTLKCKSIHKQATTNSQFNQRVSIFISYQIFIKIIKSPVND